MSIQVRYNTPEKRKQTGIQAMVYPFWPDESVSLTVRGGRVEVIGCADFPPSTARQFAAGIMVAVSVVEGSYVETANN